jgi:hypothetical protein
MQLQLSFNELRVLRRILQSAFTDIRVEVRHSHGQDFKAGLRRREATIRDLLDKLEKEERRVANDVAESVEQESLDW